MEYRQAQRFRTGLRMQLLQHLSQVDVILVPTLRFVLVVAILLPFHRLTRRQLPGILLLAFSFGFVHFGLMVTGMQTADAGTTAVFIQMGTPIAMRWRRSG